MASSQPFWVGEQFGALAREVDELAVTLSMWARIAATASAALPLAMAVDDVLVLGLGHLQPAAVEDQKAAARQVGAGAVDDGRGCVETHGLEEDLVELERRDSGSPHGRRSFGGPAPGRPRLARSSSSTASVAVGHQDADGLAFQRLADEHVFDHVGDSYPRHHRAALRHDVDQPLGLQASQGLGNREAGHAQPLADGALVDDFARSQLQRDDGVAQGGGH